MKKQYPKFVREVTDRREPEDTSGDARTEDALATLTGNLDSKSISVFRRKVAAVWANDPLQIYGILLGMTMVTVILVEFLHLAEVGLLTYLVGPRYGDDFLPLFTSDTKDFGSQVWQTQRPRLIQSLFICLTIPALLFGGLTKATFGTIRIDRITSGKKQLIARQTPNDTATLIATQTPESDSRLVLESSSPELMVGLQELYPKTAATEPPSWPTPTVADDSTILLLEFSQPTRTAAPDTERHRHTVESILNRLTALDCDCGLQVVVTDGSEIAGLPASSKTPAMEQMTDSSDTELGDPAAEYPTFYRVNLRIWGIVTGNEHRKVEEVINSMTDSLVTIPGAAPVEGHLKTVSGSEKDETPSNIPGSVREWIRGETPQDVYEDVRQSEFRSSRRYRGDKTSTNTGIFVPSPEGLRHLLEVRSGVSDAIDAEFVIDHLEAPTDAMGSRQEDVFVADAANRHDSDPGNSMTGKTSVVDASDEVTNGDQEAEDRSPDSRDVSEVEPPSKINEPEK